MKSHLLKFGYPEKFDMPNQQRWLQTLEQRPAVQRGLAILGPIDMKKLLLEQDSNKTEKYFVKGAQTMLMEKTDT